MKCSDCNKVIKPVVAVDIDGTLGDYHSHFLEFAYEYLAIDGPTPLRSGFRGQCGFKEWFLDTFATVTEEDWKDAKLAYRQGGQKRSMPVWDGAPEFVRDLKAVLDVEVWLTTTRPYMRMDNIDPDTRFWLERHGIPYDGLLYDELKFRSLVKIVDPSRVVAVVDDLGEMLHEAASLFGRIKGMDVPIQRPTQFNQGEYINPTKIATVDRSPGRSAVVYSDMFNAISRRVEAFRSLEEGS